MPTTPEDRKRNGQNRPRHSESSSSSYSCAPSVVLPEPPDGGYGWVIVFASFMIFAIADGISFATGELFEESLAKFGASSSMTAWINGFVFGMPLMLCPVAGAMVEKYGCRRVTIGGGILSCAGCALSFFANSLETFILTFGLVCGTGLAFSYMPAIVVVAFWFEKKRAFATGIAVCGTGVGTIIMAPVLEYLIDSFGLMGTMLVLSGFFLNICVFGALLRNIELTDQQKRAQMLKSFDRLTERLANSTEDSDCDIDSVRRLESMLSISAVELPTYFASPKRYVPIDAGCAPNPLKERLIVEATRQHSDPVSTHLRPSIVDSMAVTEGVSVVVSESTSEIKPQPLLSVRVFKNETSDEPKRLISKWQTRRAMADRAQKYNPGRTVLQPLRKDVFYRGSYQALPRHNALFRSPTWHDLSAPEIAEEEVDDNASLMKRAWVKIRRALKSVLDFGMLKQWAFLLLVLSNFLLYLNYDVFYVYLGGQVIDRNIRVQSWIFTSVLGGASMVGQVVLGWLGDRPWVSTSVLYCICTMLAGVISVFEPLSRDAYDIGCFCVMFGLFISANYALTTELLVQLFGMDKLTRAYGILLLAQGLANFVGPSFSGWTIDVTGSNDTAFYVSGGGILLSGLLLLPLPLVQWRARKWSSCSPPGLDADHPTAV